MLSHLTPVEQIRVANALIDTATESFAQADHILEYAKKQKEQTGVLFAQTQEKLLLFHQQLSALEQHLFTLFQTSQQDQ